MDHRILISEDDIAVARMLCQLFEDEGYEVAVAYSASHATRIAAKIRPHVVLVGNDGRGDFDPGWYVSEMLESLLPGVPQIMLATSDTAVAEFGQTERGRRFAVALLKPFAVELLVRVIDRLVRGAAGNDARVRSLGDGAGQPVGYSLP